MQDWFTHGAACRAGRVDLVAPGSRAQAIGAAAEFAAAPIFFKAVVRRQTIIDHEISLVTDTFFYRMSNDIRVTVRPVYLRDQSDPAALHYVFAYFVRLENTGPRSVQLLSRRWLIHDDIGEDVEVVGDGVVGEQPVILPGNVHEYQSFCVLKSGEGYMEGQYFLVHTGSNPGEGKFTADIPRFTLSATGSPSFPS